MAGRAETERNARVALRVSGDGPVATIRFHNPPHDFIDPDVVDELYEQVRELEADPAIRAVVLAGASPGSWFTHFDPEAILKGLQRAKFRFSYRRARIVLAAAAALGRVPMIERAVRRSSVAGLVTTLRLESTYELMNRSEKIYLAAVDGIVFGAGFILALACDLRLGAAEMTAFGLPEPVLGFVPPTGVTRLVRLLGPGRAIELLLEGRWLSPGEAADLGILHRVIPRERLVAEAQETARRLSQRSRAMVREMKRTVYDGAARDFFSGLALERAAFLASSSTPFCEKSLEAFVADLERSPDAEGLLAAWRQAQTRTVS